MRGMNRTEDILRFFSTGPVVFVASILITILFWIMLPAKFVVDESRDNREFYEPVARNILQGNGITLRDHPFISRPPGHPLFLAGVFKLADLFTLPEEVVISTVILVCTGLSSLFLFIFARQVWAPLPAALSALVWITYLPALWLTKQPNNEVPFLVFFYGGFVFFWSAVCKSQPLFFYFCSGFLIGIAMLIRPIALGVGVIMSFVIWLVKRNESMRVRWVFVAMVLLGNLVAVLPWELWVYAKTEKVVLLTRGGPNMDDGLIFAILGSRPPSGAPTDVVELMQDIVAQRRADIRSLSGVIKVMSEELWNRPLATIKLLTIKILRSWYATDSRRFEFAIMLLQIPYLAFILWGTRQTWCLGGIARNVALSIWLLVLYFWGLTFAALSIARYMVPVIGLLFVLIPACFPSVTGRKGIITR
jgi:hypothetical protein